MGSLELGSVGLQSCHIYRCAWNFFKSRFFLVSSHLRSTRLDFELGHGTPHCQIHLCAVCPLKNCRARRHGLSFARAKACTVSALVSSCDGADVLLAQSHVAQFVWHALCDHEFIGAHHHVDLVGSHDSKVLDACLDCQVCHDDSNFANVCRNVCNVIGGRRKILSFVLGSDDCYDLGLHHVQHLRISVSTICKESVQDRVRIQEN